MSLFYTRSTAYLLPHIDCPRGNFTVKHFSDGELFVRIDQKIDKAWVLASTFPPGDNLIELFLLLSALERSGAEIHLIMPYFGYARQSHPLEGEAASAHVMCNFLNTFAIRSISIIHIHTLTIKKFLNFENVIPFEILCPLADNVDSIASSDKGSAALAEKTGVRCDRSTIFVEKTRPEHEEVEIISIKGSVEGKRVLIVDDIISTGNTMIAASHELIKNGALSVSVYATHAFFSRDALKKIEASPIQQVYVTNTIPQTVSSPILTILDIAPVIQKIIESGHEKKSRTH